MNTDSNYGGGGAVDLFPTPDYPKQKMDGLGGSSRGLAPPDSTYQKKGTCCILPSDIHTCVEMYKHKINDKKHVFLVSHSSEYLVVVIYIYRSTMCLPGAKGGQKRVLWYWESNLGPLQRQQVFLIAEPPLEPPRVQNSWRTLR